MDNHNTHLVSEPSKDEHGYRYDTFGNVIVESLDDLIYDRFLEVKRKKKKQTNTKKFIKNVISKNEQEKKEINDKQNNEIETKNNNQRKSLINVNIIENPKLENEESEEVSESQRENKDIKPNLNNNSNSINNKYINQSYSQSPQNTSQNEADIVNQNTIKKRYTTINPRNRVNFNLNYSDDPIFNIKKVKDLKKMYNKKCFISTGQAEVQLKSITEEKRRRKKRKYKVQKQEGNSISPTKRVKLVYDSSDESYIDLSEEMKNYTINQLNPFIYYGQKKGRYGQNLRLRLSDISDLSKTDDKFLDSVNIKENMRKNSYMYEKRDQNNAEEEKQVLNNVIKEELSLIMKKKKKKIDLNNKNSKRNKNKNLINNNDNKRDPRRNAAYGNGKNINNERTRNNYEKEKNNSLINEDNKNINKFNDLEKEKNSSLANEDNKNVNKFNDNNEKKNVNSKENNNNINKDKEDNEENESPNNSNNKKISNNKNSNDNKNNDSNSNNDEILGYKNENLDINKLDNNTRLGENPNYIINNNINKKNNKDISKFNSEDTKNNFNDNKNESTNFGNILTPESNINPNNMDSSFNDKGQKSNTQIYINENNLDYSDNKIFKEERTFKSINMYMKKPKEIKGKNKDNEMDKIEEEFIKNRLENQNKTKQKDNSLNSELDFYFDSNQDDIFKKKKNENYNNIIDNNKNKISNKNILYDDYNDINNEESEMNNLNQINKTNGLKNKGKKHSIKKEKEKSPNFAKDNNNNIISGIDIENSNDNASVKSLVVDNLNIPSKDNSSFSAGLGENIQQNNNNKNNDILTNDKINNKKNKNKYFDDSDRDFEKENIKNKKIPKNKENFENDSNPINKGKNINDKESTEEKDNRDNNINKYNANINKKLLPEKIIIKNTSINCKDVEEEIIYNKPILSISYIKKVRKDLKMNLKPPKLNRVFISKVYTSIKREDPKKIPKIDICYTIKSNKIIVIQNKKDSYKTNVLNDYCFFTKIIGNEENLKKKKSKKKKKKQKKTEDLDESYISVSVDNKNIFPNHKFKEDFMIKNDFLAQNVYKTNAHNKMKNNRTVSNTKKNNFNTNNKFIVKNNNNEILSSIENISNNEINDDINNKENNKVKKFDKYEILKIGQDKESNKENNNEENNKNNNSMRIRVHKYNRNDSNVKIKIRNPKSPNIEYQQIEFKPGTKGYNYKIVKKHSANNFRRNKNIIQAKNKNELNNLNSIQIKTSNLKPLKINNNLNSNLIISHNNNDININNKSFDNQINIIFDKDHVGYHRHFGKEANCPLCKNMKKKTQNMENKIFGKRTININKPSTAYPLKNRNELNQRIKNRFRGGLWKEEEKNLNNNVFKDLNLLYTGQNKNKIKPNLYRDLQRKYSANRNIGTKYMFKIPTENNNIYNRNNLGNFNELEFPAINSYFHS